MIPGFNIQVDADTFATPRLAFCPTSNWSLKSTRHHHIFSSSIDIFGSEWTAKPWVHSKPISFKSLEEQLQNGCAICQRIRPSTVSAYCAAKVSVKYTLFDGVVCEEAVHGVRQKTEWVQPGFILLSTNPIQIHCSVFRQMAQPSWKAH